jgi:hypothetical protein
VDGFRGCGVDRARRVIEDQDPRVGQDGARESNPLSLATRERRAPFADQRVVSVRAPDIAMVVRSPSGA